jgi:hypothetical protein
MKLGLGSVRTGSMGSNWSKARVEFIWCFLWEMEQECFWKQVATN